MGVVTRAHDLLVNTDMGDVEQPEWMVRVKEDYFKAGESMFTSRELPELLDEMDRMGVERFAFHGRASADSVVLRLTREGKRLAAAWSRAGKEWQLFAPVEVAWGPKLKVGLVAENCLGKGIEITFDRYSLTTPKK